MEKKLFLFDLDGTLTDSSKELRKRFPLLYNLLELK